MNFLAHIYLSGENEHILLGNFIADFVKGRQYEQFETKIQQGIFLHRKIDNFTDTHPVVKQSSLRLRPDFGKFAPVIVDVFYDHFLAKNFPQYHAISLAEFSELKYEIFQRHIEILPEKVQEFLPYMIQDNWLLHYADIEGISRSLEGISRRSQYAPDLTKAIQNLERDYVDFESDFQTFFPELQEFANSQVK